MYLWSFSKHTFIGITSIKYIKAGKKEYLYLIEDDCGETFKEWRPENWFQILYELGREDEIADCIAQIADKL